MDTGSLSFRTSPPGGHVWQRVFAIAALLLFPALAGKPYLAAADYPWGDEPFSVDSAALLEAARAAPSEQDADSLTLLDEARFSFDASGRLVSTNWGIARIEKAQGVQNWSTIQSLWEPWRQERPAIRARVITPAGAEHFLDPETVGEYPAEQGGPRLFDDRRIFRAPLPAVAVGAVVEWEVVIREHTPYFDHGVVNYFYPGSEEPTLHSRLIVEAPVTLPVRYVARLFPSSEPQRTESDGRVRLVFDGGRFEPLQPFDPLAPGDDPQRPYVAVSTGSSWEETAKEFSRVVDSRMELATVEKMARETVREAHNREEKIQNLLQKVRNEVRYTGIEFGEASLIPSPLSETLKRKYGDCKDQSVLLVALLRSAGIPAHIALLKTLPWPDVETSLPGLGAFNHAIVYVPGDEPLWIDPSAGWARVGDLPAADQGRRALVVASGTTALIMIPASHSSENRAIETREFHLAESGKARVIESTEAWGLADITLRQAFESAEQDKFTEVLKPYAEAMYLAEEVTSAEWTKAQDLSKPFRIKFEATGVKRAWTDDTSAGVAIILPPLVSTLPYYFFEDQENAKAKDKSALPKKGRMKRQTDIVLPQPHVNEWHYRIVPPPGFTPHPLPRNETVRMGPAELSKEFSQTDEGVVIATLRFDTGKRRMTREEAEALRSRVAEIQKADAILITFEQTGQAHLAAGRIREALAEFRRLSRLHPKEALHAAQTAQALLAAGLGEAARKEAQRAVDLEPASPDGYRTQAWILQHDLVGRRFERGFDYDGSVAAYRKVLELDPADSVSRVNLSILFEHDSNGTRYGKNARLNEAIEEYQAGMDEAAASEALLTNLPIALVRAERFDELKVFLKTHGSSPASGALKLVAIAATEGPEAAINEARKSLQSEETRRGNLQSAGSMLAQIRRYPEAAALLTAGANGDPNSAALLARAATFRKAQRHEEVSYPPHDPRTVVMRFISAMYLEKDVQEVLGLFAREAKELATETELKDLEKKRRTLLAQFRRQGVNPDFIADLMIPLIEMSVEGEDSFGYRVRYQLATPVEGLNEVFYLVLEDGEYRILAAGRNLAEVGMAAYRLASEGNLAAARRWLDWAREETPLTGGDDPLAGPPFPRLWTKGSDAGIEQIRFAAATLMASEKIYAEKALPVLLEGRKGVVNDEARLNFDLALAGTYNRLVRYEDFLPVASRLAEIQPRSETAFQGLALVLIRLDRLDEASDVARQRLQRMPDDPAALRAIRQIAEYRGRFDEANKIAERLQEIGKAGAEDLNNLAWDSLMAGNLTEKAVEAGQRAVMLTQNQDAGILHTLASIYAELGQTNEARELIWKTMEVGEMEEPEPQVWYVFGRLAEQYGETDAAIEAYHKVTPPEWKGAIATSSYRLAQNRLAAIAQKAQKAQAQRKSK